MPRKAPIPCCSEKDRQILAEWANSRSTEWRLVERAKIINMLLAGEQVNPVLSLSKGRWPQPLGHHRILLLSGVAALVQTGSKACMICLVPANPRNMIRSFAIRF